MRISDWSSDVCSSDLVRLPTHPPSPSPATPSKPPAHQPGARSWMHPANQHVGLAIPRRMYLPQQGPVRARLGNHIAIVVVGNQNYSHHTPPFVRPWAVRSEEHTSELQSLMRISSAVFCLKTKNDQAR